MSPIRDPIHGYIEIAPYIEKLLDTRIVQRLRNVKQLGWTNLVYPGANHTRFEHSLGTYYLASRLGSELSEEERREIEIAALLHDIGHGPYSHDSEDIIEEYTRRRHDDVLFLLESDEIASILGEYGIKPSAVSSHIQGKTKIGQIITGSLDVDRMDYLIRDSYYTGVAYGIVDYEHLLRNIRFYDNNIVLYYRGLKSAESLLMSRFLMYPSVYDHHVGRIAGSMFAHGLDAAITEGDVNAFELQLMDDCELNERMRHYNKYSAEMIGRLNSRNLFKRALYVGFDSVDKSIVRYTKIHKEIEREIARMAGIEPGYVLIDIPKIPDFRERNATVLMENDQLKYLDDVSSLVKILEESYVNDWRMGVYTLPGYREKVGRIAREYFNVEKVPKQSKLEVV
ncbi:MAG TPA: HD domain-containing protein [Methanocella sp.]|uniref:HD domain-containing protein n=1 Tax=Methanocella sp. TaxID=2052833 RepID=UPI002B83A3AB|nr:HD domain-containing protein [Methanocella sp.]HTY92179.1 HD domain-containing protein [Methanocella sp.]